MFLRAVSQRAVSRAPRSGGRGWWVTLVLGVACLLGGGVPLLGHAAERTTEQDVGILPQASVAQVQPGTRAAEAAMGSRASPADSRPVVVAPPPVRLRLPRLGIDASVIPVSIGANGLLAVPDDPGRLGWWSSSGRPGMPSGNVVIDGHVDSATLGPGAFFRLAQTRPGDELEVTNAAGRPIRYTVVARRYYAKTSLPVAEVFAQDRGPRLVLVTCGGQFDEATRHYADNVAVFAVPR